MIPGAPRASVIRDNGNVDIALHDRVLDAARLVGARTLQPGLIVRFDDVKPSLSVSLAPQ